MSTHPTHRIRRPGSRDDILTLALLAALLLAAGRCFPAEPEWKMATRLYGDIKARRVGDLLTVIVSEESQASKDAQSASSRSTTVSGQAALAHPTMDSLVTPWTNMAAQALSMDVKSGFSGSGSTASKEKFTASITVRVTDLLPNGNLVIEGKRTLIIQDESMDMVLTGTVRPADISRDNTLASSDIADAAIKYTSNGTVTAAQKRGLLTRVWDWINPF